jgi:hypothetical protein
MVRILFEILPGPVTEYVIEPTELEGGREMGREPFVRGIGNGVLSIWLALLTTMVFVIGGAALKIGLPP